MTAVTPTTWPLPWRIAAALALESGNDWARWAYGLTKPRPFWPGASEGDRWERDPVTPVPDPSDAEAYRADVARRGVEPGPMPALEHTGEDGFGWVVYSGSEGVDVLFKMHGRNVASWTDNGDMTFFHGKAAAYPLALVARIATLATAAARAMEGA